MPTITQIFETLCDRLGGVVEEMLKIDREISALQDSRAHLASGHAQLSFAIKQLEPLVVDTDFGEVGEAVLAAHQEPAPASESSRRPVRQLVRDWLDDGRRRNGGTVMEIAQALQIMPRGVEKALAYWSQPSKAIVVERGGRWYSAQRAGVDEGKDPVGATTVAQEPSGAVAPLNGVSGGIPDLASRSLYEKGDEAGGDPIQFEGDEDLVRLTGLLSGGEAFTGPQLESWGIPKEIVDAAVHAGILNWRHVGDGVLYELAAPAKTARAAEGCS